MPLPKQLNKTDRLWSDPVYPFIRRILIAINNDEVAKHFNGTTIPISLLPQISMYIYVCIVSFYAALHSINGHLVHKVNRSNDLFSLLLMTQNDLVIEQILLPKKKKNYYIAQMTNLLNSRMKSRCHCYFKWHKTMWYCVFGFNYCI